MAQTNWEWWYFRPGIEVFIHDEDSCQWNPSVCLLVNSQFLLANIASFAFQSLIFDCFNIHSWQWISQLFGCFHVITYPQHWWPARISLSHHSRHSPSLFNSSISGPSIPIILTWLQLKFSCFGGPGSNLYWSNPHFLNDILVFFGELLGFFGWNSHSSERLPSSPLTAEDSFFLSALGRQAQSQRLSAAEHSISCVSRDARQNVFITERHIRPNRLGRESPKALKRWSVGNDGSIGTDDGEGLGKIGDYIYCKVFKGRCAMSPICLGVRRSDLGRYSSKF